MWSIFPRITLHFFYGRRLSPSATSVSVFICSNVERRKIRSYINSNTDLFVKVKLFRLNVNLIS